jgi:prepilin-type N-terminal cleavage/methylation domain-containing protein
MNKQSRGFTIIELSLAMTMLSILLFILILAGMQIIAVYNKGVTLKRVNQSGETIGAELQASLRRAQPGSISIRKNTLGTNEFITGICTGKTSYVWNVYEIGNTSTNITTASGKAIYFAKVSGSSAGNVCAGGAIPDGAGEFKELLGDELVVRQPTSVEFNNETGAGSLVHSLISVTFTLSNLENTSLTDESGRLGCKGGKEGEFCALNTFTITAYAKGVSG